MRRAVAIRESSNHRQRLPLDVRLDSTVQGNGTFVVLSARIGTAGHKEANKIC